MIWDTTKCSYSAVNWSISGCYLALYVVNLAWAFFVLDPAVMGGYLNASLGCGDPLVLAWFVASAATVGGGWARVWRRSQRRSVSEGVSPKSAR